MKRQETTSKQSQNILDLYQKPENFLLYLIYLVKDKFDNLSKIERIKSPLLILSGKKDEIVPHYHSLRLLNKAKVIKKGVFIDEAIHNNLYDFNIENDVIAFNLKIWK